MPIVWAAHDGLTGSEFDLLLVWAAVAEWERFSRKASSDTACGCTSTAGTAALPFNGRSRPRPHPTTQSVRPDVDLDRWAGGALYDSYGG